MTARTTFRLAAWAPMWVLAQPIVAQPSDLASVRREALHTYFHGITAEIARERIGAAGVPALLELLADPTFPRRDNVVAFLTYLGAGESTSALLEALASPPGPVTAPEEDRALLLLPQALGHIASRGEPRALEALLEMTAAGSNGGALAAAASRSPRPAGLRDDLLEMSLRGLAFARDARASQRLRAIASGEVRPAPSGRDLRTRAGRTLEALEALQGRAAAVVSRPGGRRTGGDLAATLVEGAGMEPAANDESLRFQADAAFDSIHTTVKKAPLSYANHPAVTNPMTNSQFDNVMKAASLHLGRADFSADVACCAGMQRSGNANSFGSLTDGLDVVDNDTEFYAVINNPVARAKVVRLINYCSGPAPPGSNILGCSWIAGNGMILVRSGGGVENEGALWAHEYGHNAGLGHNADDRYVMYSCLCGGTLGLTQTECGKYWTPAAGTQLSMITVGACTDNDTDEVHDLIDNCPAVGNNNQVDTDGDGLGDACDQGATPTRTRTPTPSRTPTRTPTATAGWTSTPTRTATPTRSATPTPTRTHSTTPTRTPTASVTPTRTATPTRTRTPTRTTTPSQSPVADVDGDGDFESLSDALLVMRWGFGFTGGMLVEDAVDPGCEYCTPDEVIAHLQSMEDDLDVDDDGETDPLTDAVLLTRWGFGFTGQLLVEGAVDFADCRRCTAASIEAYLEGID